jgi:hypothetical protein
MADMSEAAVDFVDKLVEEFPALQPMLREHVADQFGETLPHVFFGDLTSYAVDEFVGGTDLVRLQRLLDRLEESFSSTGDDEITNLIAVSFVENLPYRDEPGEGIRTGRDHCRHPTRQSRGLGRQPTVGPRGLIIHSDDVRAIHQRTMRSPGSSRGRT